MKTTLTELLLLGLGLLILLIVNAALVACETAMVKLRYSSAEAPAQAAIRERRRLRYLMENAATTAPVIRFGIVAATTGLGGLLFPLLSIGLMQVPLLDVGPGRTIAAILGFAIAVTLIRIIGFLTPRGLALANPVEALRWTSWVALGVAALIQPWFRSLQRLAERVFQALGMPFELGLNVLDIEVQIRALSGDKTAALPSPYLRELVSRTLRLSELEVSDILLPRNQVKYMNTELPLSENLARARRTRHTRFPLCRGTLDNCIGIIHIKDVFIARGDGDNGYSNSHGDGDDYSGGDSGGNGGGGGDSNSSVDSGELPPQDGKNTTPLPEQIDLMQLRRRLLVLRAHTPVEEALQQLLRHKVHMAIVRDDFGGTLGVITLDSILEEIVGDIVDEFDTPMDAPIIRYGDNRYRIDGLTPIHDVESALNITIDSEDVSTFGGLISEYLGRIPDAGEMIEMPHLGLSVSADVVDERRLIRAFVKVQEKAPPEDAEL